MSIDVGRLGPAAQAQVAAAMEREETRRRERAARALEIKSGLRMSESEEQQLLFEWAVVMAGRWPELDLMFHIPNGRGRSKGEAGKLKAEGVKAGVPDVELPVARGGYHGLHIEMKAQSGAASDEQKLWLARLEEQGRCCRVCRGFTEAKRVIEWYMTLEEDTRDGKA